MGLIQSAFNGKIYPINPSATEINGIKAYPDLKSIHEPVDLVFIALPAASYQPSENVLKKELKE